MSESEDESIAIVRTRIRGAKKGRSEKENTDLLVPVQAPFESSLNLRYSPEATEDEVDFVIRGSSGLC